MHLQGTSRKEMSSSGAVCPSSSFFGAPVIPVTGTILFHTLVTYIGLGSTIISLLCCLSLALWHICIYRIRAEQRQIIRIVVTPAIICACNFGGLWSYRASGYLKPIGEYSEAFAMVALYALLLTYVAPENQRGSIIQLYEALPAVCADCGSHNKASLSSYYVCLLTSFRADSNH